MFFFLFFLFFLTDCLFARPIQLINRQNQTIDILYQLTGFQGPYSFTWLKVRQNKPFVCKVDYDNKSCVVRFNGDDEKSARVDEVALHLYAQEHGFGPKVLYSNDDDGIIVMEYFTASQRDQVMGDKTKQIDLLVACVKKIHESELECRPRDSFVPDLLSRFSYIFSHNTYGLDLYAFQGCLKFLEQCIDPNVKPVFVHGDLHRFNIFFCGDSYKAIDFESGHYDHPYVDLAHLAIFFGFNEKEEMYLLEQYLNRQPIHGDLLQFAIFKVFVLAKWALWMLETLGDDFIDSKEYREMFYVKPLVEFLQDPIQDKAPAWRYRAAITALKEAERLLIFIQSSFLK